MSDIVERLRNSAGYADVPIPISDIVEEAADEIERLRRALAKIIHVTLHGVDTHALMECNTIAAIALMSRP